MIGAVHPVAGVVVMVVAIVVGVVVGLAAIGVAVWLAIFLGGIPGRIAADRRLDSADRVRVLGYIGLLLPLLWLVALCWSLMERGPGGLPIPRPRRLPYGGAWRTCAACGERVRQKAACPACHAPPPAATMLQEGGGR